MDVAKVMKEKNGCCKKMESMPGSCHLPPQKRNANKEGCTKNETTCICFCCFQFAAPPQDAIKFDFNLMALLKSYNRIAEERWNDPYLSVPWQPPDMA